MKIFITAKSKATKESVKKIDGTHFVVSVTEPPIQGRANHAIIRALADHFNIKPYQVRLVSGATSKQKIVEIKT